MVNYKKPITFLPTKDIRIWYESLEEGRRTKILNSILTVNLPTKDQSISLENRLLIYLRYWGKPGWGEEAESLLKEIRKLEANQ